MLITELLEAATRFRAWLFDAALPYWSTVGHDGPGRGFVEHLSLAGTPANVPYKRVRVQARQVAVFSQAYGLGFEASRSVARDGFEFMVAKAVGEDGRVCKLLGRDGSIIDDSEDLYDTAFVLFACACYGTSFAQPHAFDIAWRIIDRLVTRMRAPDGEGFVEQWPRHSTQRAQNPHMHLFEALLAMSEGPGGGAALNLADELLSLFMSRMCDVRSGVVSEFFAQDWSRPRAEEDWIEPGHVYEWISLLIWYEERCRALGRASTVDATQLDAMLSWALRFGHARDGRVIAGVTRDGSRRNESSRIWHQTEAIRAHALMLETGRLASLSRLTGVLRRLQHDFLDAAAPGVWIEAFGPDGAPSETRIPASSLYHIMGACAAVDRLIGFGRPPGRLTAARQTSFPPPSPPPS